MYHNTHAECSTSFRKILTTPYPGTYHNTHAECSTSFRKIILISPLTYPGTMVVHFLTEEAREKYELEKLWTLGRHHDDQYQSM